MYKGLQKGTLPGISGQHFKGLDRGIYKGLQHNTATIQKETMAWLQAIDKSGYPCPSWRYIVDMDWFIINLKQAGIWPLLDRLWVFATEHRGHARIPINIPTATPITEINSPVFTKYKGYKSDGTSSYLNSNFICTTGSNFAVGNNSYGIYMNTNTTSGIIDVIGTSDGTYNNVINCSYQSSNISAYYDNSLSSNNFVANPGQGVFLAKGLYVLARTSAINSSSSVQCLQNNVLLSTTVGLSYASSGIPVTSNFILSANNSGTPFSFKADTVSLVFFGSGNINQTKFYNIITGLAQRIGFNI